MKLSKKINIGALAAALSLGSLAVSAPMLASADDHEKGGEKKCGGDKKCGKDKKEEKKEDKKE